MTYEVIIAGFGGQGILLMGKILALAGMFENRYVTWFPSYGAEMRGGTAHCTVIISDQPIGSPVVAHPEAAIIMNQPSMEKFVPLIKPNGVILINSSLVSTAMQRDDLEFISLPVTEMANTLGASKVANIIALSAFCAKTHLVSSESLERAMQESFSVKDPTLLQINEKAIAAGRNHIMMHP
jgi:2-oxoglutarate ferredoxin oxidoreductase subunit gamma